MFEWISDPQAWIALATLTALELILGVDNIIFISILAGKVEESKRGKARTIGLLAAMIMRIVLLFSLAWVIGLTEPLFSVFGNEISGRDLILVIGGLFLLAKSTHEIHQKLEGSEHEMSVKTHATFGAVIAQIMALDIVFSLDSVITAVGMVRQIPIMVIAVVISVGFMLWWAKPLGEFVERHPTVKMLALSFLLLIGMALVADGIGHHIPKGYIYFAMGFSVFVEMLNLRLKKLRQPSVDLRERFERHEAEQSPS
jgi:predicted tellurium resistance membrane protein TerC